ncbi:MAG TPA: acetyl-CoA carboxylase biotin carboxylase subunit [Desulfurobacteriaceae bacterium]|nr:acetyl-CoA carboxylase biotin carboxylase subunit [Desulfurobacteriaceae bacterium]
MIKKILIANRGEIAIRIIRTCKELGIKTVAVYSTADKNSLHVELADEAYCIGGPHPQESYLNIPAILSAAEISNADAIHPGYGFLAENASFAEIVEACGYIFIGPSYKAIDLMGNKVNARKLAKSLKIPVVPGYENVKSLSEAKEVARKIGYPILIKAACGGGGRGIKVVYKEEDLEKTLNLAIKEAESSFGSPQIFIEKFIENPKHIEVQILGDMHGNVVALGERECSLQRRHQKLLEEAPSPFVDDTLRENLYFYAKKLAEKINYHTLGTVEFIVDKNKNPYFIEMNTRVQVEHPVTEMVIEEDLIAWQILTAVGEKIFKDDKYPKNHAIEFRINAEDPYKNFMPSIGKIEKLHLPAGYNVRVDTHIYQGYVIPPYYDSLLAKIIVKGKDRKEALKRGLRALQELKIENIKTTKDLFLKLYNFKEFLDGSYHTKSLEKELSNILKC